MIKIFIDPIYDTKTTLYYHEDVQVVLKAVRKFDIDDKGLYEDLNETLISEGAITITPTSRTALVIIPKLLTVEGGLSNFISIVSHECFHVTCHTMRESGIYLVENSEEAFAYYLGWLNKVMLRTILADVFKSVKGKKK